jgi:hypothetical protein
MGCYLGGYVGGAWNDNDATFTDLGNTVFAAYSGAIVLPRREGQHSWNVWPASGLDDTQLSETRLLFELHRA